MDKDRRVETAVKRIHDDVFGVEQVSVRSAYDIVDIGQATVILKKFVPLELPPSLEKGPPLPCEADLVIDDTIVDPVVKTKFSEGRDLAHVVSPSLQESFVRRRLHATKKEAGTCLASLKGELNLREEVLIRW
jgi:hypothetical protein